MGRCVIYIDSKLLVAMETDDILFFFLSACVQLNLSAILLYRVNVDIFEKL